MVNFVVDYEDHTVLMNFFSLELDQVTSAITERFPELNEKRFKVQQYIKSGVDDYIDVEQAVDETASNKLRVRVLPKSEYIIFGTC